MFYVNVFNLLGCTVVWWSAPSPHSKGSRFDPHLGPFCVESACSPRVCVGSLRVLRLPPTVQKHAVRLIGDSKLTLLMSMCVAVCPVMDWRPVQGVTRLSILRKAFLIHHHSKTSSLRPHDKMTEAGHTLHDFWVINTRFSWTSSYLRHGNSNTVISLHLQMQLWLKAAHRSIHCC